MTDKEKEILKEIGKAYINRAMPKNPSREEHQTVYDGVNKQLIALGIHNVEYFGIGQDPYVIIHLERPGLIIGAKGSNIDYLTKQLGISIQLKEYKVLEYLLPFNYVDYAEYPESEDF